MKRVSYSETHTGNNCGVFASVGSFRLCRHAFGAIATGFKLGDHIQIRRNHYSVVGLTRRMVSSGGDPMVFIRSKMPRKPSFLRIMTLSFSSDGVPPQIRPSIDHRFRGYSKPS
jgi:hypothetical protein